MKNGQSVEAGIQPMDVSISGGPVLIGKHTKGAARNSFGTLNITIEGKSR